jgi:hypothetical protein
MALTLELPSTIENQLKKDAIRKGLSIEAYLLQLINKANDFGKKQSLKTLSESELLKKINLEISEAEWTNYRRLVKLRQNESLTEKEHEILILLGEKIEKANAKRLEYLAALAQLKNVSLKNIMDELGIHPVSL